MKKQTFAAKLVQRELRVAGNVASALSTPVLVGLAEELIPSRDRFSVLDMKLNIYAQSRSCVLNGTARLVYQKDQINIWETDLAELDGDVVARLVHTLLADPDAVSNGTDAEPPGEQQARDRKAAISVEERREAIARAACDVISRKGFAASSIREIADATGMHVPTLYQYVSSKDEVLELVYRWVIRDVKDSIAEALRLPLPPAEKLVAVTSRLLEVNARTPRHTGVLNRELRSLSKSARARVLGEYEAIMTSVSDIIVEGIELGEFRAVNPRIAANFIDALCDMWALRQFAVGQFSLDEYESEVIKYIKSGLFIS